MDNNRIVQFDSIQPQCNCCFPAQVLVVNGERGYCPLTEKIYQRAAEGNFIRHGATQPGASQWQDYYPGRNVRRGEVAPMSINPAEERFGAR